MTQTNYLSDQDFASIYFVRLFLLVIYLVIFTILFWDKTEIPLIFVLTLTISSLLLWLGPISALGSQGYRKIYDPSSILNLSLAYYIIKGVSLGWGEKTAILAYIPNNSIIESYVRVSLYLLVGMIFWNVAYKYSVNNLSEEKHIGSEQYHYKYSYSYLVILISLGIISLFLFYIIVLEADIFLLLLKPYARAYLSSSILWNRISFCIFFLAGCLLLTNWFSNMVNLFQKWV